jgi:hypothetical protein
MKTQGWRLGSGAGFSVVLAAGFLSTTGFFACAGKDIPEVDNEVRDDLATAYPEDETGSAGSANSGGGAAGAAGSGGSASGTAGSAGRAGSGTGGSTQSTAGTGGSGSGAAGSGNANVCDAWGTVLVTNCSGGQCHSTAGTIIGDFAVSEAAAAGLVDQVSSRGASCGVLIDPDNTDDSLILKMVKGTQDTGSCFPVPMPLGGDDLSATDQACIQDWLTQFAE